MHIAELAQLYPLPDRLDAFVQAFADKHGLSPQQAAVLRQSACGLTRKEVAALMGVSPRTVEEHWRRIYGKTDCRSEPQVVARLLALVIGG
jgi:DNA-binding CsgD family transcriptional regulator